MTTNSKPTLRAYVVPETKHRGIKPHWIEVGALWPQKNGNGFTLVIPEGISVSGRVVCVEPKAKPTGEPITPTVDFADIA